MPDIPKKILLIEDNELIRDLYKEVLEKAGFMVITAVDGEDGLQKAIGGGFALIISDLMLPKLDGLQLLNKLNVNKSQENNGKILILTNLDNNSIKKEVIQKGAADYLVKSNITPMQLVDKVKQLIL